MKTRIVNISKFSKHMFMLTLIMLFSSVVVFSQGDESQFDIQDYFITFSSFVLILPIVVEFIKKLLPGNVSSLAIQIISWTIGIALAMLAWFLKLGFFADIMQWWQALAVGFGASLVSNGIFDTGIITWLLSLIGVKARDPFGL